MHQHQVGDTRNAGEAQLAAVAPAAGRVIVATHADQRIAIPREDADLAVIVGGVAGRDGDHLSSALHTVPQPLRGDVGRTAGGGAHHQPQCGVARFRTVAGQGDGVGTKGVGCQWFRDGGEADRSHALAQVAIATVEREVHLVVRGERQSVEQDGRSIDALGSGEGGACPRREALRPVLHDVTRARLAAFPGERCGDVIRRDGQCRRRAAGLAAAHQVEGPRGAVVALHQHMVEHTRLGVERYGGASAGARGVIIAGHAVQLITGAAVHVDLAVVAHVGAGAQDGLVAIADEAVPDARCAHARPAIRCGIRGGGGGAAGKRVAAGDRGGACTYIVGQGSTAHPQGEGSGQSIVSLNEHPIAGACRGGEDHRGAQATGIIVAGHTGERFASSGIHVQLGVVIELGADRKGDLPGGALQYVPHTCGGHRRHAGGGGVLRGLDRGAGVAAPATDGDRTGAEVVKWLGGERRQGDQGGREQQGTEKHGSGCGPAKVAGLRVPSMAPVAFTCAVPVCGPGPRGSSTAGPP